MKRILRIALLSIVLFCCNNKKGTIRIQKDNYVQLTEYRMAAEWEPAKGVCFVWPPVIPKDLVIEFAKDTHIFPVVDGENGKKDAQKWLNKWNIDITKVTFIDLKTGYSITTRDWGPSAIFGADGEFKMSDGIFYNMPSTGLACDDSLTFHKTKEGKLYIDPLDTTFVNFAKQLGYKTHKLPFVNTGGNILTDGIGTAFSTCAILAENNHIDIDDETFFHLCDSLLGISKYNIISNFYPYGIQHIDCLIKLTDEETMLVAEPPKEHKLYDIYDSIVTHELSKLKTPYNRPYTIKRIKIGKYYEDEDAEYLSNYTNSLILNDKVYVPMFGIKEDSLAMETWASVMPGYTIKGFDFVLKDQPLKSVYAHYDEIEELGVKTGWFYDDALHCRDRALWDENMLFISVKKILPYISKDEKAIVYATVVDYGDISLVPKEVTLNWRIKGEHTWQYVKMKSDSNAHFWNAQIPKQEKEIEIEYFVEAVSNSEKSQTRPITAPKGFYKFKNTLYKNGYK